MNVSDISSTPGRRGWLRKLFWLVAILVVLLVAAYFLISNNTFIRVVVLPRVGGAMNAELTAGRVDFSPFSRLELRNVKFTPKGGEPLFTASLIRVRYALLSMLGGRIAVDEIALESPAITVVENADGTSNLDPLRASQKAETKEATKPSAPPSLDVKSIAIKNGVLRHSASLEGGGRQTIDLTDLNLNLTNLRNGATGKLDLSASLGAENTAPGNGGTLRGKFKGSYTFDLTSDLNPTRPNGSGAFTVQTATGEFADFNTFAAALDCEATPTEVKEVVLRFTQSGQRLGQLRVSGPFDAAKSEGKLDFVVLALDRRALNLFGAASGLDFGTTVLNSTNVVELAKNGSLITASGRFDAKQVQLTRQGQSTPTLDLVCEYALTVDRAAQSTLLQSLNLLGAQDGQPLLRGGLTSPMTLPFGAAAAGAGDAALNLAVINLNLAQWRAFVPDLTLEGTVNATVRLASQAGGKKLSVELDGQLAGGGAKFSSQTLREVGARVQARATSQDGGGFAGRIAVTDLAGRSGENAFANLTAALDFDVATKGKLTTLSECSLTLSPTTRAKNVLRLTGSLDTSDPDAITGALKLTADSLDATAYYDAFAGQTTATPTPATSVAAPTPANNTEPAVVKLPFKNFTAEINVGRFHLREVDAQDFQLVARLDRSHVLLKPAQLALNGAPIRASADLDLGVPGFKYEVAFSADGVPVDPLANSFSPTYRGQAKGTLIANTNIKGAGVTGRSLQKTLNGDANLNFTNANIQIVGPKVKAVMTPIALVLGTPELLRSPLDYLTANLRAANGKIEVPNFVAHSEAFIAESQGVIPIADVLKDSPLNQDIEVSLARNLANKLRFSNVPTNVAYVELPTFVRLKGTLGSPEPKTDKAVIVALTAAGIGGAIGGKAGGILEGVGSLLGGKPSPAATTTNAAGTTATNAQPQSPVSDLINLLKKPKK